METRDEKTAAAESDCQDEQAIADALHQMESLYISRCVQTPLGTNVVVRDITDENDQ